MGTEAFSDNMAGQSLHNYYQRSFVRMVSPAAADLSSNPGERQVPLDLLKQRLGWTNITPWLCPQGKKVTEGVLQQLISVAGSNTEGADLAALALRCIVERVAWNIRKLVSNNELDALQAGSSDADMATRVRHLETSTERVQDLGVYPLRFDGEDAEVSSALIGGSGVASIVASAGGAPLNSIVKAILTRSAVHLPLELQPAALRFLARFCTLTIQCGLLWGWQPDGRSLANTNLFSKIMHTQQVIVAAVTQILTEYKKQHPMARINFGLINTRLLEIELNMSRDVLDNTPESFSMALDFMAKQAIAWGSGGRHAAQALGERIRAIRAQGGALADINSIAALEQRIRGV
jgi:hypothetical protein